MKKTFLKTTSWLAVAIIGSLSFVTSPSFAQESTAVLDRQQLESSTAVSQSSKKAERIIGVWDSQVTIRSCQTGAALATFRAMETILGDGGLVDTNAAPPSTRGPGFGRWEYLGGTQYKATFRFFLYNPDGTFAGVRRVSRIIELDGDNLMSTVSIEVFDPNDVLISTGCGTELAKRVE